MQAAIMSDPTRFRIVPAGRRFGKTVMANHEVAEYAMSVPETLVWWVSPTYDDANELGYDRVKALIPNGLIDSDASTKRFPRMLVLTNGSRISFRSADREDALRGRGVDFVVVDEAGSIPDSAWYGELRPALTDTLGHALVIGTPKGRNWFHDVYVRGEDDDPRFADYNAWHATSYDNPHVEDSEIEEQRETMPLRTFKQEYLAEFLEDSGGVFRDVRANIVRDANGNPRAPADYFADPPRPFEAPYQIGVDLARTQNYAVTIAVDAHGQLAAFERENGVTWTKIQKTIERVANDCAPHTCYIDASRDNKIVQDLDDAGVNVEPIKFSNAKKRDMVETLAVKLEQGDLVYPDIQVLINELQVFAYDATPSGNVTYGAPQGHHDDTVDAYMLATRSPAKDESAFVGAW